MEENYSSVRVLCKAGTCKTKGFKLIGKTGLCGLKARMRKSIDTLIISMSWINIFQRFSFVGTRERRGVVAGNK